MSSRCTEAGARPAHCTLQQGSRLECHFASHSGKKFVHSPARTRQSAHAMGDDDADDSLRKPESQGRKNGARSETESSESENTPAEW